MHADRTNRFALLLFGLLCLVAGAAAMALSVGLFGTAPAKKPLFDNKISTYVGRHGTWLWAAAAVLAVLVALLMIRWIATLLLSTDRSGDLEIRHDHHDGKSVLKPSALTNAVVAEIQGYRGVDSARARALGDTDELELALSVTVDKAENLTAVRQRIETEAVHHARAALDRPSLPVLLDLTVAKTAARVR